MNAESSTKLLIIAKVTTLVVGVVVLGIGLHSHFQSSWVKPVNFPSSTIRVIKPYKICENKQLQLLVPTFWNKSCPHISMEHFFVSIIITCFILSLIGFAAGFVIDLQSKPLKWIDLGYHVISAILLLVAAIVYIVSATQIDKIFPGSHPNGLNFRKSEKIAAGAIAIIQAVIYCVVGLLIVKF